jgi:prevent-host-death family protein
VSNRVTALEAKTRFGKLLDRVARGEEIVVTRHDKPVARIVPEGGVSIRDVRAAVADLRHLRRGIAVRRRGEPKLTRPQVKALIGEGRR